ncbi:CDP-glycerol glycerophosphotransferase family protein [Clostridium beijerinckii]|uniref:CDP-glycerol glycerophosphotransferase family protein n=1 Tax=Clostridium beijerinckii TaxID=1520 RepID=UPI00222664CD|nr:CDP-glycerol glycerophosphotransferase family protein [Clostridium beijerinckii]UYZ34250.1 CDP-glycerol glycerophosphotransferase family protein [Clostridium beijerinckii]
MFLKIKKQVLDLINTIEDMLNVLLKLSNKKEYISDCILACDAVLSIVNKEKNYPQNTIQILEQVKTSFEKIYNDDTIIKKENISGISKNIILLKKTFDKEITMQLNVVFLPYKVSMWDSLETVYEAAIKDENCSVKVVPIPYYQLNKNNKTPVYEGNRFPTDIPIVPFNEYSLDKEQPDIIFVHNIYDQYNTITQVFEEYFTENLKKYTDMLVYVPYHISTFLKQEKGTVRCAYSLPGINNVDKVILAGEHVKKEAIRDGVPKEKIITLGSPKFDGIVNRLNSPYSCPESWKEAIEGKTVYLLNTGCMYFAANPFEGVHYFTEFLSIPKLETNSVVIWRPHPLTEASIIKFAPNLYNGYLKLKELVKNGDYLYKNIILDETDDYIPALQIADVLISGMSSILQSYLVTEKKVLFWGTRMELKNSMLPSDVFYYAHDEYEPWYELIKKFPRGYDPLAKNRRGMVTKVYSNTDGTCGEKVYKAIKEAVLNKG